MLRRRKRIQAGQVSCIKKNSRPAARFLRKELLSKMYSHRQSIRRRRRRLRRSALQYRVHHGRGLEQRLPQWLPLRLERHRRAADADREKTATQQLTTPTRRKVCCAGPALILLNGYPRENCA